MRVRLGSLLLASLAFLGRLRLQLPLARDGCAQVPWHGCERCASAGWQLHPQGNLPPSPRLSGAATEPSQFPSAPEKTPPASSRWVKGGTRRVSEGLFPPLFVFRQLLQEGREAASSEDASKVGLVSVLPPPSAIPLFLLVVPSCSSLSLSSLAAPRDALPLNPPRCSVLCGPGVEHLEEGWMQAGSRLAGTDTARLARGTAAEQGFIQGGRGELSFACQEAVTAYGDGQGLWQGRGAPAPSCNSGQGNGEQQHGAPKPGRDVPLQGW